MARGVSFTLLDGHAPNYLLYLGLDGSIELRHRRGIERIPPGRIALWQAHQGLSVVAEQPTRAICVTIPAVLLHRRIDESTARSYSVPVEFHQDRKDHAAGSLALRLLADCLSNQAGGDFGHALPSDFAQTENILLALLLEILPHSPANVRLESEAGTPWYIRMAEKHIEDRIAEPISMEALARVTGMSARTLHEGFRKHQGYSPMKFLREQRLLRVHRELSEPCDSTTVTDVALKWGFCHLGRFSWYYSDHFGEKPSDTLVRARARERSGHPATQTARAGGR